MCDIAKRSLKSAMQKASKTPPPIVWRNFQCKSRANGGYNAGYSHNGTVWSERCYVTWRKGDYDMFCNGGLYSIEKLTK